MKSVRWIFLGSMLISVGVMAFVVFQVITETGVDLRDTNIIELAKNEDTLVIVLMPVILVIVLATMLPFYRIMFPAQIKNGVHANAKVLKVWDTGVSINDNPQVGLLLELRTQEGTTLEVEAKTIVSRLSVANVQPGVLAQVIYDPAKPQRLTVESFEVPPPAPAPSEEPEIERTPSTTERLLELNDLRARGLVTEEEFQTKRSEILKGL